MILLDKIFVGIFELKGNFSKLGGIMGKKVQEMLDNANQRVPKVEVNQAMEWMNDGNTVFVDVRSKDLSLIHI